MSVNTNLLMQLATTETLGDHGPALSSTARSVTHNGFDVSETLNSEFPVDDCAFFEQALSDGAATIDLTDMDNLGRTVDATGKKVQAMLLRAPSGNGNQIEVSAGASNGYDLFGSGGSVVLKPGQAILLFGNKQLADVASGEKNIDLSGTGTDELQIGVVVG